MTSRTMWWLGGDVANSAYAHRPSVDDRRKVVLRGARKHVGAIDQCKSSSVIAAPRRLHLSSVKLSGRLAAQAFERNSGHRVENALENDSFSWYDNRHSTNYCCTRGPGPS